MARRIEHEDEIEDEHEHGAQGRSGAVTEDELTAWVTLHSVEGIGAASLARLIARFGSAAAVVRASPDELEAVPKVPGLVLDGIRRATADLGHGKAVAARLLAEGVGTLSPGDAPYPSRLHALASPPPLLYVRGRLPADGRPTLAVVGTTEPSERGRQVALATAQRLARAGWVIVSGHARGIDEAAHTGAFLAKSPTLLVLPTGILRFRARPDYPPPEALWRHAAALSEWHPEARWRTQAALARNRVVAALSDALLAVEMREAGGTMSTLRHAIGLGRRTFVVRFHTPSLSASGNRAAEEAGARPVRSIRELESFLAEPAAASKQRDLPLR